MKQVSISHSLSAPSRFLFRHRRAKRRTATFLIAVGALVCATVGVLSAPGDLDTTFNGTGKVTTPIGTGNEVASAIAIQPDGKILAAGDTFGATRDFALARYNVDGSLDSSFDGDGKVTTDFNNSFDTGNAVALQSDGKIVMAGNSLGTSVDFALVRYLTNGALDTSFGGTGKVTTSLFGSSSDTAYAVAVQPDGKIVAGGITDSSGGSHSSLALVRYNSDGSVDSSFGTSGRATTTFDTFVNIASSVVIQSDGKIVAAGSSHSSSTGDFAVARFNPNGSLDTTFDGDGKVTTDFGNTSDRGYAVAIQTDGKLVVAGYASDGNARFALARYNSNGSLDSSFGGTGKITTTFLGVDDYAFGVAVQTDGKIVAAGYASSGPSYSFALARYSSTGALDLSFGSSGKVMFDFSNKAAQAQDVAIQADGKIVASGNAYNGANIDFALARLSGATTIIVNSTADVANGSDGLCTLREAIQAANSNTASGAAAGECAAGNSSESDTINFSVTGTITLLTALPDLLSSMSLNGPGANLLTISGNSANRVFSVSVPSPGTVTLAGLTLSNGQSSGNGGGILKAGTGSLNITGSKITGNSAAFGGGIFSNSPGPINIINSTLSNNTTAASGFGGAIFNAFSGGTVSILNSTVMNNSAVQGFGGGIANTGAGVVNVLNSTLHNNAATGSGSGGGIFNQGGGPVNLTNATFSGNSAGRGGALVNSSTGTVIFANSTVANNSATTSGGGIDNAGTVRVQLRNTIVALNTAPNGPDLNGTFTTHGRNLVGNNAAVTSQFPAGNPNANGDLVGTDVSPLNPMLGPLQNNGGPTHTMLPLPGSPAINAGNPTNLPPDTFDLNNNGNTTEALPVEQRGFERVAETNFDIGAVETNYSAPVLFVEDGTNRLAAIDSVTFVRGPFRVLSEVNFSADKRTRILFFTSNLGMTQPDPAMTVEAGGIPLEVEAVGLQPNNSGLDISYVIVKLADGLPGWEHSPDRDSARCEELLRHNPDRPLEGSSEAVPFDHFFRSELRCEFSRRRVVVQQRI